MGKVLSYFSVLVTKGSDKEIRIKSTGDQYDDRVVEVHWDKPAECWRMMRFRDDKPHGNHKSVVQKIIESIRDGVEKEAAGLFLSIQRTKLTIWSSYWTSQCQSGMLGRLDMDNHLRPTRLLLPVTQRRRHHHKLHSTQHHRISLLSRLRSGMALLPCLNGVRYRDPTYGQECIDDEKSNCVGKST